MIPQPSNIISRVKEPTVTTMRPASEIDDEKVLHMAQEMRSLLVPSPDVLLDTVRQLHPIVSLSNKVLPLKSYFNIVQDIQRTKFVASVGPTVGVDSAKKQAQRALCTEDIFMLACAYLQLEIAKQGSIYYLTGESPDFKETKLNRNPLDLSDEVALKTISSGLARPDAERGAVERGQIDSGFNHLAKINTLHRTMQDAVALFKQDPALRKIDIRNKFGLSHTDYERMMSMARREGLISLRSRKKDPANSYQLKQNNHARVVEIAKKRGHTPQKTLNQILEDFFAILDKRPG
nr:hypothetical protein [Xanthomonas vasicola]MDO6960476.1 hypothetical protein [Xanthomonas vasicola]